MKVRPDHRSAQDHRGDNHDSTAGHVQRPSFIVQIPFIVFHLIFGKS